jgi:hypothetical protein
MNQHTPTGPEAEQRRADVIGIPLRRSPIL